MVLVLFELSPSRFAECACVWQRLFFSSSRLLLLLPKRLIGRETRKKVEKAYEVGGTSPTKEFPRNEYLHNLGPALQREYMALVVVRSMWLAGCCSILSRAACVKFLLTHVHRKYYSQWCSSLKRGLELTRGNFLIIKQCVFEKF